MVLAKGKEVRIFKDSQEEVSNALGDNVRSPEIVQHPVESELKLICVITHYKLNL